MIRGSEMSDTQEYEQFSKTTNKPKENLKVGKKA